MRALFAVLAVALLVICAPARAATVTHTAYAEPPGIEPEESCSRYSQCPPGSVDFRAAPGETNVVTVTDEAGMAVFRDAGGATLTGAGGCAARADGTVACPAGIVSVDLGDGDDSVQARGPLVNLAQGGPGDDQLSGARTMDGGDGADTLIGSAGSDKLVPGPGRDVVSAAGGDDEVIDGVRPEADQFDGGGGVDLIIFTERATPVRVDLGARPQEAGSVAEANVISSFEAAIGGTGADLMLSDPAVPGGHSGLDGGPGDDRLEDRGAHGATLEGGPGADVVLGGPGHDELDGGPGEDTIEGGGGSDIIEGGINADSISGGAGRDTILAEHGADRISGGSGNDRIAAGEGEDQVSAGSGNDVISAADRSRDRVRCGTGRDRLTADRRDRASRCERVRRRGS